MVTRTWRWWKFTSHKGLADATGDESNQVGSRFISLVFISFHCVLCYPACTGIIRSPKMISYGDSNNKLSIR